MNRSSSQSTCEPVSIELLGDAVNQTTVHKHVEALSAMFAYVYVSVANIQLAHWRGFLNRRV